MAWKDDGRFNLRDAIEANGAEMVAEVMIAKHKEGKFSADEFSLREAWDAFTNNAPLPSAMPEGRNVISEPRNKKEAVGTGSFVKITSTLINSRLIEAYEMFPTIGQNFCTEVSSKLQKETITGATALALPELVPQHKNYNDSGFGEKYVTISNDKYGRILSLTEEMIFFDQTGQMLNRARMLGEGAAYYKEQLIMEGVQDLNTPSTVYFPSDTATAVYSTAHKNLISSNGFSDVGLRNVEKQAQLQTGDGETGDYIMVSLEGKPLLVPSDLTVPAWELSNNTTHPETAERADNFWKGKFVPYTSPWVTRQSTTTWYWGDFKKACWWLNVWPLQTMTAKPGHEDEFNKDIMFKIKVRFFGGFGFVDHMPVFKCTA